MFFGHETVTWETYNFLLQIKKILNTEQIKQALTSDEVWRTYNILEPIAAQSGPGQKLEITKGREERPAWPSNSQIRNSKHPQK